MAHTASNTCMLQSARPCIRPFTSTATASLPPSQCRSKAERRQTLFQSKFCLGPSDLSQTRRSAAVSAFGHSSHATSSDPESLVNQFYELAQKGSKPDSSLVSSLNSSLEKKGSSFGPQEIANLLWSVAKTGTKLDPKILATLVGLVSAKAGSFKPAQISAVLWALGTLGQKVDPGVITNLGKAIGGQVSNFDPRSLTDALWGFAKMGGKLDGGTISKLAQRVKELASKFKPQEAANALWALVKLDQENGGNAMKAILAVGAGSMAVNAVKGVLGGGDKADEEVSKHAKKASSGGDDGISKALDSLRKSGADPAVIKAMAEAAKKSSKDGHDSNGHLVDAVAALQKHGHGEAKEEHHSGGLFGLFGQ
ncbi:hypothetical protein ABBQ32_001018 [Trebouxia sp. C0010 RCD-2024]